MTTNKLSTYPDLKTAIPTLELYIDFQNRVLLYIMNKIIQTYTVNYVDDIHLLNINSYNNQ